MSTLQKRTICCAIYTWYFLIEFSWMFRMAATSNC